MPTTLKHALRTHLALPLLMLASALPALADGLPPAKPPSPGPPPAPAPPATDRAPTITVAPSGPIAARVNGREVTQAELDRALGAKLVELLQTQYYARVNALLSVAAPGLEQEEAQRRGITLDQLLRTEVAAKVVVPTEEEIITLRSLMKDKLPDDPEQARAAIIHGLVGQRQAQRRAQFQKELYDKATVEILLEPPRIVLADAPSSPSRGPANAPVTIIEFGDFECTQCASIQAVLKDLETAHPGQIRVVFRQMPLSIHEHALGAAGLAACAADQGKFWELHDWLFANQHTLEPEAILAAAPSLGIDADILRTCDGSGAHADEIQADLAMARALGVNTTPFILVNGRPFVGSAALQQITSVVADELRRAKVPATAAGGAAAGAH